MSADDQGLLRKFISEDLKNVYSKHEPPTPETKHLLRTMHDAPGVMKSLPDIDTPRELAGVIEAVIDACSVVGKDAVLQALQKVMRHEKKTRR